jgi:hypothetical protein
MLHFVNLDDGPATITFENIPQRLPDGGMRYFVGDNGVQTRFRYMCEPDVVSHELVLEIANAISSGESIGKAGARYWRVTKVLPGRIGTPDPVSERPHERHSARAG